MKRSRGSLGQSVAFTAGAGCCLGLTNAQCGSYLAPCAIQRVRMSFSAAESGRCSSGGGMTSSGSVALRRAMTALRLRSPGTMAVSPLFSRLVAPANSSRRKPALRPLLASGPWQPKQRSERIGRTSRLKSTRSAATATAQRRGRVRTDRRRLMGMRPYNPARGSCPRQPSAGRLTMAFGDYFATARAGCAKPCQQSSNRATSGSPSKTTKRNRCVRT